MLNKKCHLLYSAVIALVLFAFGSTAFAEKIIPNKDDPAVVITCNVDSKIVPCIAVSHDNKTYIVIMNKNDEIVTEWELLKDGTCILMYPDQSI